MSRKIYGCINFDDDIEYRNDCEEHCYSRANFSFNTEFFFLKYIFKLITVCLCNFEKLKFFENITYVMWDSNESAYLKEI